TALLGAGRGMEQETPFRAWRDIMITFFNLSETIPLADQQRQVIAQVESFNPALVERLPLLNDIFNLGLPDTELTANLEPTLRYQSLVSLMITLFQGAADQAPPVIILEDAYWLDITSWDLTLQLVRGLAVIQSPFLLMAAVRPPEGLVMRPEPIILAQMEMAERLTLDTMPDDEIRHLAAARLGVSLDHVPAALTDLICQRAGGNPFYAEEVIHLLQDQAIIHLGQADDPAQAARLIVGDLTTALQQLPHTVQQVVQARIDRLPPEEQLTVKVAAVLGRTFTLAMLRDILAQYAAIEPRRLRAYMDDLTYLDLLPVETIEPEMTYIFKHIITQEVAYGSLLFSQRRQLHRTVAEWYEGHYADQLGDLEPHYPLLVHHYHHAEDAEKERYYAELAGQRAARQYANAEAIRYFSRALALTPDGELSKQYELRLARERVIDLRGEREAQQQDLSALQQLMGTMAKEGQLSVDREIVVALRQAHYAEVTGDYPTAVVAAERALAASRTQSNALTEMQSLYQLGLIARRQGDYQAARSFYEQALTEFQEQGHYPRQTAHVLAQLLSGLTIIHLRQSEFKQAKIRSEQALTLSRKNGHKQDEAQSLNNLGLTAYRQRQLSEAIRYHQDALLLRQTIGDRASIGTSLLNISIATRDAGDYTKTETHLRQALMVQQAIGNRWEEINIWNDLGILYQELGKFGEAQEYLQRGLAISQEINDKSGEAFLRCNLGLVMVEADNLEHAQEELSIGLALAREQQDKDLESGFLSYLSMLKLKENHLEAAIDHAQAALTLRHELGLHLRTADDLATLALAAIQAGDLARGLALGQEAFDLLETCQGEGPEFPQRAYFICYHVFTANGEPERAHAALASAYTLVMDRANNIIDPALRQSFLEQVMINRAIVAAYQGN
ncbi:MAG: tetratricopeptide repeat protein, partial [Anaerolineae bacterium]|nr:tetratricopeptide repeat protein [Anaerolineae bacterium]